jgi:phospholipid transport system substrate-binding protein
MMRSLLMTAMALTLVMVLAVPPASAGAPTDQLKTQVDRVLKLMDDPTLKDKPKDKRAAVRRVADDIFDFGETAKRSLGRHWADRTQAERDEFVKLFGDLLERSYISKIELYGGEKIQYVGDKIEGDQASVMSKLLTKTNTEVPIEYRMLKKGERWLVYDVIIEGVSLVSNYRAQFNKIIRTESYEALVKKLRAKDSEPAASTR